MIALLHVLGCVLLGCAAGGVVLLVRLVRKGLVSAGELSFWCVAGLFFGMMAAGARRQSSPTLRILGFPFPAAVWEFDQGVWRGSIDGGSILLLGLDFLIGFMAPIVYGMVLLARRARRKGPPSGGSPGGSAS